MLKFKFQPRVFISEKDKVARNEKRKKLHGFSYYKNIANFEAFWRDKNFSKNLLFLGSDLWFDHFFSIIPETEIITLIQAILVAILHSVIRILSSRIFTIWKPFRNRNRFKFSISALKRRKKEYEIFFRNDWLDGHEKCCF